MLRKHCRCVSSLNDFTLDLEFDWFEIERLIDGLEISLIFHFFLENRLIATLYYDFSKYTNYTVKFLRKDFCENTNDLDLYFELKFDDSIIF